MKVCKNDFATRRPLFCCVWGPGEVSLVGPMSTTD
jgi:hypothetical protein